MRTAKKALVLGGVAIIARPVSRLWRWPSRTGRRQGWSYEIKDGKRVPKGNRVNNSDGSWRETVRQGNCVTIKEKSRPASIRNSPVRPS